MSEHPSLFDHPVGPLVRATDPSTSHAAAESMTPEILSKQRADVLCVLLEVHRRNDGRGATAWDVVRRWSLANTKPPMQNVVARRLTDLEQLGFVEVTGDERPGSSSRMQKVHYPTAKALEVAA
jgi:hypothetical protein